jgi:hypothetical protein
MEVKRMAATGESIASGIVRTRKASTTIDRMRSCSPAAVR